MQRFHCVCETQPELFFDSTCCVVCSRLTGFCDDLGALSAFEPAAADGLYRCPETHALYRQCANYAQHKACNGMVAASDTNCAESLCFACHFNQLIPDLSVAAHLPLWQKMEKAKRRALYTLTKLGLQLPDRKQDPELGLAFAFIADSNAADHFQSSFADCDPVYTGHHKGVITINLAEADEVARANTKVGLAENYRTLLGHFRHELGHYFWDRLIAPNPNRTQQFRNLFGDETVNYQNELERHYQQGPPANWQQSYISAYATMHPWEDWAETWAHYLHIIDTLETAKAYGFELKHAEAPAHARARAKSVAPERLELPQEAGNKAALHHAAKPSLAAIISTWLHFSVALNALNRSMGIEDAYPFVLTDTIQQKLNFVHDVVYSSCKHHRLKAQACAFTTPA